MWKNDFDYFFLLPESLSYLCNEKLEAVPKYKIVLDIRET